VGISTYLDHNASTPLDPRVLDAMMPYLRACWANPSSIHAPGRQARQAIDQAREQVAALVGAHPARVVFTSGGTEANNLALKGYAEVARRRCFAVSAVEHASVLGPALALEHRGWQVDILPVDGEGRLILTALVESLDHCTGLVSVMMANNETGVLQDLPAISEAVRTAGGLLHTDAVQAAGKVPVDFQRCGAHMLSLSAHKLGGPKGAGALIVNNAVELEPLLVGGGQERGLRGGTENVPGIVGFGVAAELAGSEIGQRRERMLALRRKLEAELAAMREVRVFGQEAERLPNTVMFSLPGIAGETLLMGLDRAGFALASGSACSSQGANPSHVLLAMGVDAALARGAVRVSFGPTNELQDVERLCRELGTAQRLRAGSAVAAWEG
jgi:cysteine desulfurase